MNSLFRTAWKRIHSLFGNKSPQSVLKTREFMDPGQQTLFESPVSFREIDQPVQYGFYQRFDESLQSLSPFRYRLEKSSRVCVRFGL